MKHQKKIMGLVIVIWIIVTVFYINYNLNTEITIADSYQKVSEIEVEVVIDIVEKNLDYYQNGCLTKVNV